MARPLRRRRARNGPGVVENATASSERSLETAGACWTCSGPRCPCFSGGVAERVATKIMSRETRPDVPSDHPTASVPRFSSIGGGQNEPVCGAATPLDVQSGSDALSRPITGAPLARASGERGTRQLTAWAPPASASKTTPTRPTATTRPRTRTGAVVASRHLVSTPEDARPSKRCSARPFSCRWCLASTP